MKRLAAMLCGIMLLLSMTSCATIVDPSSSEDSSEEVKTSETGITALELFSTHLQEELGCGEQSEKNYFMVSCDGDSFSVEDIEFISEDENVAVVSYEPNESSQWVYYTIRGVEKGNTRVYFQTKDGVVQSDKIEVSVTQKVSQISLPEDEVVLEANGDTVTDSFTYKSSGKGSLRSDIFELVCGDNKVVTFSLKGDSKESREYELAPVGVGETEIYIQTKDGTVQSNKVKVSVRKKEEPQSSNTSEASQNSNTQSKNSQTSQSSNTKSQNSQASQSQAEKPKSRTVYITPKGKKYHFSKACAGKNATPISLDEAKKIKDPCKKCAHN